MEVGGFICSSLLQFRWESNPFVFASLDEGPAFLVMYLADGKSSRLPYLSGNWLDVFGLISKPEDSDE